MEGWSRIFPVYISISMFFYFLISIFPFSLYLSLSLSLSLFPIFFSIYIFFLFVGMRMPTFCFCYAVDYYACVIDRKSRMIWRRNFLYASDVRVWRIYVSRNEETRFPCPTNDFQTNGSRSKRSFLPRLSSSKKPFFTSLHFYIYVGDVGTSIDIPDRYVFDICDCICLLFCNLPGEFSVIDLESVWE